MQISAVIITFNEERNIDRCISSLVGVVDEVIIVDSLSTDRTKEICTKYELVKFYSQEWLGYSSQKNYANKLASNEAILSIDADEVLSAELKQNILAIKAQYDTMPNTIFEVKRLTNYCGSWIKHSGWYPDKKKRIFNKSIQWVGDIHEELLYQPSTKTQLLQGDLYHYTVYNSSEHIKQIDKFTTLLAKQALEKGKKAKSFDLWFRPKWKFFRDYIIKRGFLDGSAGYQVCKMSAFATFLKYAKIKESNK
ncbi:MAG: glycosyltransferase family 2 protein [Bacteroidales bacterium]|jgi:glycosyltransferase involved in cell wall biosynthesis|nr:glycosyltransferase family 2 protein [Bacteroidales bacterium]MDD4703456.1 glycosyltransferase family 2 protein [Bacteroidales bacterium]MDX9798131.1 glycosyltransferase family 2 protein [Bacteroidales bacterium]